MTILRQANLDPAGKTQSSSPETTQPTSLINQLVAVSPLPVEWKQVGRSEHPSPSCLIRKIGLNPRKETPLPSHEGIPAGQG